MEKKLSRITHTPQPNKFNEVSNVQEQSLFANEGNYTPYIDPEQTLGEMRNFATEIMTRKDSQQQKELWGGLTDPQLVASSNVIASLHDITGDRSQRSEDVLMSTEPLFNLYKDLDPTTQDNLIAAISPLVASVVKLSASDYTEKSIAAGVKFAITRRDEAMVIHNSNTANQLQVKQSEQALVGELGKRAHAKNLERHSKRTGVGELVRAAIGEVFSGQAKKREKSQNFLKAQSIQHELPVASASTGVFDYEESEHTNASAVRPKTVKANHPAADNKIQSQQPSDIPPIPSAAYQKGPRDKYPIHTYQEENIEQILEEKLRQIIGEPASLDNPEIQAFLTSHENEAYQKFGLLLKEHYPAVTRSEVGNK